MAQVAPKKQGAQKPRQIRLRFLTCGCISVYSHAVRKWMKLVFCKEHQCRG
jgi:hypothetical protein